MTCSFSKSGFYPGDVVCPTDGLQSVTLSVLATGKEVVLLLCPSHYQQLMDMSVVPE